MTTPLDTKKISIQNFSFSPLSRKHSSSYQSLCLLNFYKTHEVDVAKTWFELSSSSKKPDEYENFVRISKSFTEFLTQSSSTKLPALLLQYLNLRQSQGSTRESVFSDLKLFEALTGGFWKNRVKIRKNCNVWEERLKKSSSWSLSSSVS